MKATFAVRWNDRHYLTGAIKPSWVLLGGESNLIGWMSMQDALRTKEIFSSKIRKGVISVVSDGFDKVC